MIETDRLILRHWKPSDTAPFTAINKDEQVMEFLPKLSDAGITKFINDIANHFTTYGFGLFACEKKDTSEMIGYVGLYAATFKASFTPCMEIGWRLDSNHWGKGYATEAAQIVMSKAFSDFALREVFSFTVPQNARSRRVMEKIGMTHDDKDDFYHPLYERQHPFSRHVLYRMTKEMATC